MKYLLQNLIFFLFLSIICNAQSGQVAYQIKYGYSMPTDTATLRFNAHKSFFDCSHGFNNKFVVETNNKITKVRVKNNEIMSVPMSVSTCNGNLTTQNWIIDQIRYTREPLDQIVWAVHSDTMRVLGYTCQKATATFRGRGYTAWFAEQIPVGFGPWKFNGLPGLILAVTEGTGNFSITAVNLKMGKSGRVKTIKARKAISFEEYYRWMTEYLKVSLILDKTQINNPNFEIKLDTSALTEML